MFSTDERSALLDELVAAARHDPDVVGAAELGSGAVDASDPFSDVDLAFWLIDGADPITVLDRFTTMITDRDGLVDTLDLAAGTGSYRVHLLPSTLQVDLSVWPGPAFVPGGPRFRVLFGEATPPAQHSQHDRGADVGMAWLYALHVRTALARGRVFQAVYMINALRERVITLACERLGLVSHEGRGSDELPASVRRSLISAWPSRLDAPELRRAFEQINRVLVDEVARIDHELGGRLDTVLAELVRTSEV